VVSAAVVALPVVGGGGTQIDALCNKNVGADESLNIFVIANVYLEDHPHCKHCIKDLQHTHIELQLRFALGMVTYADMDIYDP